MNSLNKYWPKNEDLKLLYEADIFIKSFAKRINSFLVINRNGIVFERYYNKYELNKPQHICSVTKCFTAALIGIAIDKGFIKDEYQYIIEFFPEYDHRKHHHMLSNITINHLITMTSGIMGRTSSGGFEPVFDRVIRSKDWVLSILELPIQENMVGKYRYNSLNSHLLSIILTRAAKMDLSTFANQYLFEPIGIEHVQNVKLSPKEFGAEPFTAETGTNNWPSDPFGYNLGHAGLCLKPRDLARFAYLYLNCGNWDGKQIISDSWIKKSLASNLTCGCNSYYGFHWYSTDNIHDGYRSSGYGGQEIYIYPEEETLIIMTSKYNSRVKAGKGPADVINKFILPWLRERGIK